MSAIIPVLLGGASGGGVPEAPVNGTTHGRKDGTWVPVAAGGSYPEVTNYADLPDPVANDGDTYLVVTSDSSWWNPFRKPAGLYRAESGAWSYKGPIPEDYFNDSVLRFTDGTDPTKKLSFQLDQIAPATTREVTWPNKSGIVAFLSDLFDGTWASLTGKPSTFPPSTHSHPQSEVTNLVTDLAGKAAASHTHAQSDVTGLVSDLAAKQPLAAATLSKLHTQGSDIASAATVDLDAATGDLVDITGTTGISAITLAQGRQRIVRFTGALTLTHGSSLVLPNAGGNITTAAGDFAIFRGYGSGVVRCVVYQRHDGTPLQGGSGGGGSVSDAAFATAWNGDTTAAPSKNALWDHLSEPTAYVLSSSFNAFNNMPATAQFCFGSTGHQLVQKIDLTNKSQVKFLVNKQGVAGAAGSKLVLRYNTTFSTNPSVYSDIGTSAVEVGLDTGTQQVLDTGWIDLAAGAKAVVFVTPMGYGGDGVADPTVGTITALFR